MLSFLLKIVNVFIRVFVFMICLLLFPFVYDIVHNELYLAYFEVRTRAYSDPPGSQLVQKIALVGNFAQLLISAVLLSLQCTYDFGNRLSAKL